MDSIEKALKKLLSGERRRVKQILEYLQRGSTHALDIKKLKGRDDVFRVRMGSIRILYRMDATGIRVLAIERRNEHTYRLKP